MRTKKGLTKTATAITICASLMLLTFGAWTAFAAGETVQEIEAVWGAPAGIQKLSNGTESRYYKYDNTLKFGFRTFVFRDGRVVDGGIACDAPEAAKKAKTGLPVSDLSQSFYQNNPTTVQALEQTWGKPVAVRALADGSEERYYKYDNTINVGFRYFQVMDGKVVASGVAREAGETAKTAAAAKGVPMAFVKEEGTESIAEVERVWGKPLNVKKLTNGMEERYYKCDNTLKFGDRMFLFKDGKAVATAIANF